MADGETSKRPLEKKQKTIPFNMLILVRVVEEKKRFGQIGKKILMAVSKIIQKKRRKNPNKESTESFM